MLASDERYPEIYRGTPPQGALEAARDRGGALDNLIIFHSLSSVERRGPALRLRRGEARLIQRQAQLINFGGVATPFPILAAATELWQDEAHVADYRAEYIENFNAAQDALEDIFGEVRAEGGFFLWLDVGDGEAAAKALWGRRRSRCCRAATWRGPMRAASIRDSVHSCRTGAEPAEMSAASKRMAPVLARVVDAHAAHKRGRRWHDAANDYLPNCHPGERSESGTCGPDTALMHRWLPALALPLARDGGEEELGRTIPWR